MLAGRATPTTLSVPRGPMGSYLDEHVYLGHTRLSIVHPEPIFYGDWVVTMNGEIYNHPGDSRLVPKLLERQRRSCPTRRRVCICSVEQNDSRSRRGARPYRRGSTVLLG